MSPPPCSLPKERFTDAKQTKGLRKEPGRGIPQSQVGTSKLHFQVLFLAKRGEKAVSFAVSLIPEEEREGVKKRRQLCDGFGNQLKQKGKSPLLKKKVDARAKGRVSPDLPIPGKTKCQRKAQTFAEAEGGMERGARLCPGALPARCRPLRPAALRSYRQRWGRRQRAPAPRPGRHGGAGKEGRAGGGKKN